MLDELVNNLKNNWEHGKIKIDLISSIAYDLKKEVYLRFDIPTILKDNGEPAPDYENWDLDEQNQKDTITEAQKLFVQCKHFVKKFAIKKKRPVNVTNHDGNLRIEVVQPDGTLEMVFIY